MVLLNSGRKFDFISVYEICLFGFVIYKYILKHIKVT